MIDLTKKRITVTGSKGFLGTHLVRKLKEERKCPNVMIADLPEYDLRTLVELIVKFTHFNGKIIWDTSKPDGQPRRMLDTSRAEREFCFKSKITLEKGLKKTIDWYITA